MEGGMSEKDNDFNTKNIIDIFFSNIDAIFISGLIITLFSDGFIFTHLEIPLTWLGIDIHTILINAKYVTISVFISGCFYFLFKKTKLLKYLIFFLIYIFCITSQSVWTCDEKLEYIKNAICFLLIIINLVTVLATLITLLFPKIEIDYTTIEKKLFSNKQKTKFSIVILSIVFFLMSFHLSSYTFYSTNLRYKTRIDETGQECLVLKQYKDYDVCLNKKINPDTGRFTYTKKTNTNVQYGLMKLKNPLIREFVFQVNTISMWGIIFFCYLLTCYYSKLSISSKLY